MTEVIAQNRCTGCRACVYVCPQSCIAFSANGEGFLQPHIDAENCMDCRLCVRTCPVEHPLVGSPVMAAFSARNKDAATVRESSSGGVFTVLAETVIGQGGVVYGAAYREDFRKVQHRRIDTVADIAALRGSKYVQSDLGTTFRAVKDDLAAGRQVYYSGTPCQIAGLLAFLGKHPDNLITQDLICHGVPSPAVWETYISSVAKGRTVTAVNMRNKAKGWQRYTLAIDFSNGETYAADKDHDAYLRAFSENLSLRRSCGACQYKSADRISDITLADHWGFAPDDRGLSLVGIHSEKGLSLWKQVADRLEVQETSWETALTRNRSAVVSAQLNPKRDAFFSALAEAGDDAQKISHAEKHLTAPPSTLSGFCKKAARRVKRLLHT